MSAAVSEAAPVRRATLPALAALGVGLLALMAVFWPEAGAAVRVWTEFDGVRPLLPGGADRRLPRLGQS